MEPIGHRLPGWYRVLATVIGLVSIGLAFVVLADPALGVLTLVLLLALALLVIGIDRLVAGLTGHPFGAVRGFLSGPPGAAPPTAASAETAPQPPAK
jgi:hypothetical protein